MILSNQSLAEKTGEDFVGKKQPSQRQADAIFSALDETVRSKLRNRRIELAHHIRAELGAERRRIHARIQALTEKPRLFQFFLARQPLWMHPSRRVQKRLELVSCRKA